MLEMMDFKGRDISIHAPREGSDNAMEKLYMALCISIHAPREGSDKLFVLPAEIPIDFNPRSP